MDLLYFERYSLDEREGRVERRLAAILAADVVGYTRLMGEDEAGTLERLTAQRKQVIEPLIAAHRGRIVKLMGDGLLVEFASVVDATLCAMEWQDAIAKTELASADGARLCYRIGINLGDVISEGGDIYGDGVNVAARLEALAEPGAVYLSEDAYRQVRGKADIRFADLGKQKMKNVAEALGVFRAMQGAKTPDTAAPEDKRQAWPHRPSIAVLPFTNMSGDPEQEYFSDGITEDIITELSRFRSLFVIARNSSFAYKGRPADVRAIGRDLGVHYIAEGSVRRGGGRIRVTAQLIDARSGSHLWAERYDRDLEDIFAVQDEITQRIVTSIAPRIEAEALELAKRKPPEDMRAYDYFLRAKPLIETPRGGADLRQARECCDRAIEIDPCYARAHAQKAFSYVVGIQLMEAEDVEEWRQRALECAEMAIALDPMDGFCHWTLGEAAFQARQHDRALDHMARALAINPNDADVLAVSGYMHALTGEPEAGLRQMAMALERNPLVPRWYHWLRGIILFTLGRYDEALRAFNLYSPPNPSILRWRAISFVQLGRIDEARGEIRALLSIQPSATLGQIRRWVDYVPDLEGHLDALRQAGLPE
jgi:adenylate cyclase